MPDRLRHHQDRAMHKSPHLTAAFGYFSALACSPLFILPPALIPSDIPTPYCGYESPRFRLAQPSHMARPRMAISRIRLLELLSAARRGWWQAGMAAPGPPSRTPPTPMQALGCNLHVRGRENPGSAWAVLHSSDVVYVRAVWQSVFAVDSKRAARARFVHARAYAVHRIQPSCPTSPRPT